MRPPLQKLYFDSIVILFQVSFSEFSIGQRVNIVSEVHKTVVIGLKFKWAFYMMFSSSLSKAHLYFRIFILLTW